MKWGIAVAVLSILLLSGCSDGPVESKYVSIDQNISFDTKKAEHLRDRFIAYWDARSTHAFDKSYAYELPYIRFLKNAETYKSELSVTFNDFNIMMSHIDFDDAAQDRATVYRTYKKGEVELRQKTRWYYVNEEWYRKYDFSLFPE